MTDDFDPQFNSTSSLTPTLDPAAVAATSNGKDASAIARSAVAEPIAAFREETLQKIRAGLRPGQQQMADWEGGPLAVSAVPGAGKSTGMAVAAAIAIARYNLTARRQLVVVTFTRAAAANIRAKINEKLEDLGLPVGGFVVYTLHALALNIARQHQELSGLDLENSTLILPTPSNRLTRTCVELWINDDPRRYQRLIEGVQFDGEETERLRRQSVLRTEVLPELSWKVIQEAKSSGLTPSDLRNLAREVPDEYEILAVAAGLYENYQKLLKDRQLIDYDDMILGALRVLENERISRQWQERVFAVFEDEAQDSTPLQTKLLEKLAQNSADKNVLNLVRVGDPNQAINSTFTPADPVYFREFCENCKNRDRLATMDRAGRSSQIIIDAANFVLKWVNNSGLAGTEKPFQEQEIHPVYEGDPQHPNPAPTGSGLELYRPRDVYHSVELIAERVIELIQENPQGKFAILVRENKQGEFISNLLMRPDESNFKVDLRPHPIKIYDVSLAARQSRIPAELLSLLQFIDRPHSPDYLKAALKVFAERQLIPNQDFNKLAIQPEQFLYPGPLDPPQSDSNVRKCQRFCRSLLQARLELAPFQLISFLALTLQYERSELATADKLAERIVKQTGGNNSIPAIVNVLNEIVSSERFETVDIEEDSEQNDSIYTRPGQLTIITMHKAKGLDWDYVFLPFLQEQTIPGNLRVLPQTRFLGTFTLSEVARAQIRARLHQQNPLPDVIAAWEQAGYLKTAEEYRLLYVAMTRAKRLLWMSAARKAPFSWNKPENLQDQKPCPILPALQQRFPEHFLKSL